MSTAQARREARLKAKDISGSPLFRALVTAGLVVVGCVHWLIGVLALQMAWLGSPDKEADQRGALQAIAVNPAGGVLLWIVAVALIGLFLWKLTQAWWGYGYESERGKRIGKRLGAAGGAVMYLVLAVTAIRSSIGGSPQSGDSAQQTRVGELLAQPFGQVLAVTAALVVIGYGVLLARRGLRASFTKELDTEPSEPVKRLGQVGHLSKAVAIALVGVMLGWAAVTYDPQKATGLDDSLRLVSQQPAGPILLTLIAIGLIGYGVYCFSWSRHARY